MDDEYTMGERREEEVEADDEYAYFEEDLARAGVYVSEQDLPVFGGGPGLGEDDLMKQIDTLEHEIEQIVN